MKVWRYLALLLLLPIATAMAAPGPGFGPGGGVVDHDHSSAAAGGEIDCLTDAGNCVVRPIDRGARFIDSTGAAPLLEFHQSDGVTRNAFLFAGTTELRLQGEAHGAPTTLLAENNAGSNVSMFEVDPDGGATALRLFGQAYPAGSAGVYFTHTSITRSWNVSSITDATGTGNYDIDFTAGVFGSNPVCTCHVDSSTQANCVTRAEYNSTRWQIAVRQGGTLTDSLPINVICWSVQP